MKEREKECTSTKKFKQTYLLPIYLLEKVEINFYVSFFVNYVKKKRIEFFLIPNCSKDVERWFTVNRHFTNKSATWWMIIRISRAYSTGGSPS